QIFYMLRMPSILSFFKGVEAVIRSNAEAQLALSK
ncbi:MAG: ArsR family transcriptional regulator, partial [Deltaproteobacteria bacterium]|nr:ArsR family transcriptional regulator [Deltaproteobacteria bacterium]